MVKHKIWAIEEEEFLRTNYKIMLYKDIAIKLGRSSAAVTRRAFLLKLTSGRNRFRKGHKPWNYGLTKDDDERVANYGKLGSLAKKGKKQPPSFSKFLSERMKKKNPMDNPESRKKVGLSKVGKKRSKEIRTKIGTTRIERGVCKGKNNPNWKDGISFEPYGLDFNKELKEAIRKRDNYRCQQCFRHQDELRTKNNRKYKLGIHHIDFNKKNNNPTNLISLCFNCHSQTQFNREKWTEYFQNKVEGITNPIS